MVVNTRNLLRSSERHPEALRVLELPIKPIVYLDLSNTSTISPSMFKTDEASELFLKQIDKERNIYEPAQMFDQNRRTVESFMDILQDPITGEPLKREGDQLIGDRAYKIHKEVPIFNEVDPLSKEWQKQNAQFLKYNSALSTYTLVNSTPVINYVALRSEIGFLKQGKVLDVGGGTGQVYGSFFQFPEAIEYYLLDPNLTLLHDQFLRIYPKLAYLKMAHILSNAEQLPIKDSSFDTVVTFSAIDHFDDYQKFMNEAYRVLKPGGKLLVSSHLDIPVNTEDHTSTSSKLFSSSFWERVARYLYYRGFSVGEDDHMLHIESSDPMKEGMEKSGFSIEKHEEFKRYYYVVGVKPE